ncbi:type II toxin-antitoxin system RelE/ParE family toxin [Thiohalophilus thiocyanatoxydans]|uniref:Plasmid stabilization system protein ParE n=1 Tax=Thiohalophilus thiocyanatoxydans TaxID=381308 RepID=A0A4R8IKK8_9GAMM|nr:type II toxin-antitoxin system RelE/ParE family toxin [Thiohalophilus thiocyanatoxydans]TDX99559.1 plasmid stabilization system protein ParE [Thiohalophilus thiocyanatoxydans]
MRATYSFRAQKELQAIVRNYNKSSPGLGMEFMEELDAQIELCFENPEIGLRLEEHHRRLVMKRFPFNIIYRIRENEIRVIAVAHQHREPGYWLGPKGKSIREPESGYSANIINHAGS